MRGCVTYHTGRWLWQMSSIYSACRHGRVALPCWPFGSVGESLLQMVCYRLNTRKQERRKIISTCITVNILPLRLSRWRPSFGSSRNRTLFWMHSPHLQPTSHIGLLCLPFMPCCLFKSIIDLRIQWFTIFWYPKGELSPPSHYSLLEDQSVLLSYW